MDGDAFTRPVSHHCADERELNEQENVLDTASKIGVRGLGYPLNLMAHLYYEYGTEPLRPPSPEEDGEAASPQPNPKS